MKLQALIPLLFLLIASCNPSDRYMDSLEALDPSDEIEGYRLRLGYSAAVMLDKVTYETAKDILLRLIDIGAFTEARYCIDHLLKKYGEDSKLLYMKAVCLENELQIDRATALISFAIEADTRDSEKYRIEFAGMQKEKEVWEKINRINEMLRSSDETNDLLIERAGYLISLGQFMAANFDLDMVIRADSMNTDAYYLKGMSYLYAGNYEQAYTALDKLEQMDEAGAESYSGIAEAAKLIYHLSARIGEASQDAMDYLNMARQLSMLGANDRALEIISMGLKLNRDDLRLLQAKLLVQLQTGDRLNAVQTAKYIESLGYSVDPELLEMMSTGE
ncbi:MAG: hypothetical protein K9J30_08870 [Bacteroidales bacterium]|nr:hypothetical protein [Bacteroidales bacterium]